MWVMLSGFAVFISLLLWGVLNIIIRARYKDEAINSLSDTAWIISSAYGSDRFDSIVRSVARTGEYFVQIITEDGDRTYSIDFNGQDAEPQQQDIYPENIFEILDDTDGVYAYEVQETNHKSQWRVQAQVLALWKGNREVLVVSKSLMPVDAAINMLNSMFYVVLAIVLSVAVFVSYVLSGKFLSPIEKLTKKAELLAGGDFTVEFPKEGYAEIEYLGNTLEMAAKEFSNTEQLRRELIANVSHDMRTPLTVIKAYAEMIQTLSGDNREKREEHLEVIISETDKLSMFIKDTLDLSKLQSKTYKMNYTTFKIEEIIFKNIERYKYLQESKGYIFETDVDEDLYVEGDEALINQVIYNFINNAVKFDTRNKLIHVKAYREDDEAVVSVKDHGKGIAEEQLNDIWTRYYIVDPYGEEKSGLGIGLSIVKESMELHHARYGVKSKKDAWTEFWFALKTQ